MHGGLDGNGKPAEAVYGQSVSGRRPGGLRRLVVLPEAPHQLKSSHWAVGLGEQHQANVSFRLQEIHKRVMALSFRNCHTKIRHVDAHATLNEGVVVQVMGELSNNMQPMRKFMQTFVLAPEVSRARPRPLPPHHPQPSPAGSV